MDLAQFKSRIKGDNLSGWYIFSGEEDYLKKYYMSSLRSRIVGDDAFLPFNHVVFDAADIDFAAVAEAIKSPPMMSEYKLIEWRFANLNAMKEGEREALVSLFELKADHPYAVFAITTTSDGFDEGTPKRPSRLATRLREGFEILSFQKSTDSQLLAWLKKHFDAEGVAVSLDVLKALLFRSGRSMDVLNNEVYKLSFYAKANGKDSVTASDVEAVASPSTDSDAFALSNAVLERDQERAFAALLDLKARRVEPPVAVAMLERTYSELASVSLLLDEGRGAADVESILRLHAFKAKLYIGAAKKIGSKKLGEALSELRRIDAASKSGGISGYGAIEIFITKHI
ncbi:MAG: DNA polymerase III subunit delta [Clostridia bacterium]|nr:DNA polymerase III subunit delta [Clostridia bacterium]